MKISNTLASFPVKVSRSADERSPRGLQTTNPSQRVTPSEWRTDCNLLDGDRIREKRGEKLASPCNNLGIGCKHVFVSCFERGIEIEQERGFQVFSTRIDGWIPFRSRREEHSNPWIILSKFVSPCSIKTARLRGT